MAFRRLLSTTLYFLGIILFLANISIKCIVDNEEQKRKERFTYENFYETKRVETTTPNFVYQLGFFVGTYFFAIIGVFLFIIGRAIYPKKQLTSFSKSTSKVVAGEYCSEIVKDQAFFEALKQSEEYNIVEKKMEFVEAVPQTTSLKTEQKNEAETKENEYNKKQSIVVKIVLFVVAVFIIFRAGQSFFKSSDTPKEQTTVTSQQTNEQQTNQTINYENPEKEFLDNKIQHYTSDNRIPNFKINLSLPMSWVIKPPKYTGTINSFIAKNGIDNVNFVLIVYDLGITSPNLTQTNLSSTEGLKKIYYEMSAPFTDKELITTSPNDILGNYDASSILYLIFQKTPDNQTLTGNTKAYFVVQGEKVICFMETYSNISKVAAEKTKEKYSKLSKLIFESLEIVAD